MIISASRRTDIPAFYTEWFINRIRAGYCTVPNPFNSRQVSRVSLKTDDVDVIVFWTRNPLPLLKYLPELDNAGFRYYFLYTLMDNPKLLDPKVPPSSEAIPAFRDLSKQIGADKVVWRYDPIVLSTQTGPDYHIRKFSALASALKGHTGRVVISFIDIYKSIKARLDKLEEKGLYLFAPDREAVSGLAGALAEIAKTNGMEIFSCAEELDLQDAGVKHGKCIDDELIRRVFGITMAAAKDPAQRDACGCIASRDIGVYDTCAFNCAYCYATRSFETAKRNLAEHDPASPSLSGWHEAESK